ncbi:MAG: phytoene/squalene synthase family protein [Dongiaceae bacterium]
MTDPAQRAAVQTGESMAAVRAGHADEAYCLEQVRRYDRDRYLTALFAPAARRPALLALYAFNLEVARTREMIREPMMGRIRLQWWRDCIAEIYAGRPRQHQVVLPLARAIGDHGLPRAPFDRLIDSREADMAGEPPADLAALVDYADATAGGLGLLALDVLRGRRDRTGPTLADAARHVGIAWALTGLLRAVPFHARAGRLHLPQASLDRAGVSARALLEQRPAPTLPAVVREVVDAARTELQTARQLGRGAARADLPALLPAVLAARYLDRIERSGFDVFDRRVAEAPPGRLWWLALAMLRGRF